MRLHDLPGDEQPKAQAWGAWLHIAPATTRQVQVVEVIRIGPLPLTGNTPTALVCYGAYRLVQSSGRYVADQTLEEDERDNLSLDLQ
jgi:hypothetical protein